MTNTTQPETQTRNSIISTLTTIFTRVRSNRHESQPLMTDHSNALDVLADDRRRYIIAILAATGDSITLSDLADAVAARENDCSVQNITSKQHERAYISAYQSHLPKLDRLGYLDFDRNNGTVTPTDRLVRLWDAYQSFCTALNG